MSWRRFLPWSIRRFSYRWLPAGISSPELQKLLDALSSGEYRVSDGSSLKVESLDAVMTCVTFHDGGYQARIDARHARLAERVARFLRLRRLARKFAHAAELFEAEAKKQTLKLRKSALAE